MRSFNGFGLATATLIAAGALLLIAASSAQAAVTPISGAVAIDVQGVLTAPLTVAHDQSWTGVPADLTSGASVDNTQFGYARGHGTVTATWTSVAEGEVLFDNYGWELISGSPSGASVFFNTLDRPDWRYDFTAGADGVFTMDWLALVSGDTFGFSSWWLYDGATVVSKDPSHFGSGTITYALNAGQTYSLRLVGNSGVNGNALRVGSEGGLFDWRISETDGQPGVGIPEPGTWALMLMGFGLVGAGLRARRRAAHLTTLV